MLTVCDPMDCSTPGFPAHHYVPEFAQAHGHCVDDAIQPSYPLLPLSSCPQSFPASELFPGSPSNEYLGLISFRVDWFDLHAVHGTLKSLLQNHSLKYSVERGGGKAGRGGGRRAPSGWPARPLTRGCCQSPGLRGGALPLLPPGWSQNWGNNDQLCVACTGAQSRW